MTGKQPSNTHGRRSGTSLFMGVGAILLVFVVSGFVSYRNTRTLNQDARQVTHTHEILWALSDLLSLIKDAETGQRGYLITGDDRYLEPYTRALSHIDQQISDIERLIRDDPDQQSRIPALKEQVHIKLSELDETVVLRRTQGIEAARAVVVTDRGKAAMDATRHLFETMQEEERVHFSAQRLAEMDNAYEVAVGSGFVTGGLGVLLIVAVAYLVRQAMVTRQRQEWLQSGQIGLSHAITGDPRLEQVGERVLQFLAEYVDAQAGAFFAENSGGFRRIATYGVPAHDGTPEGFEPGDGLLGQAVKDNRTFLVREVPDGYLTFGSAFGRGKPQRLVIAPVATSNTVKGVLELGFIRPLDELTIRLLETVSESVGVAVKSANYRAHLHRLFEETQRQAEELQAQGEELRVSNEELEEQGRGLKESQARLEQQQVELEQTNAQLEEQAVILESQRDDLIRSKDRLQLQTRELEQASQYKSDFLANMSHELRTPLNSSLVWLISASTPYWWKSREESYLAPEA